MTSIHTLTADPQVSTPTSFQDLLQGKKAFYAQPDYLETTKREFALETALPASYTWDTEPKIIQVAKRILSIVIFPIGLYQLVHQLAARLILPASRYPQSLIDSVKEKIDFNGEWKYKRFTVEVDGYQIDAAIVGKASTFNNGRWVLASNGNGEFYEAKLADHNFKQILTELGGNGIVFNYPGVAGSSGGPSREAMSKAYRAMLTFLEDQQNGIGAKEIIGYGHSIGGGVQGDALLSHNLQDHVKYVFVKSRTFSDLSSVTSSLLGRPLGFLVKLLGWNISSVESSKRLQAPEIILQTGNIGNYKTLRDHSQLRRTDGVIPAEASLAKALLEDPTCPRGHKVLIAIPDEHNEPLSDPQYLAAKIENALHPHTKKEPKELHVDPQHIKACEQLYRSLHDDTSSDDMIRSKFAELPEELQQHLKWGFWFFSGMPIGDCDFGGTLMRLNPRSEAISMAIESFLHDSDFFISRQDKTKIHNLMLALEQGKEIGICGIRSFYLVGVIKRVMQHLKGLDTNQPIHHLGILDEDLKDPAFLEAVRKIDGALEQLMN
jgi:hypothetical protein